eukprot:TRINITY_DN67203_c4_g1_i1.p1 TRINITY_DN67203_c4_g1~~TRINITY_DN67203_c4_g1_i1.p1  ORF type:complete len:308 (+),score=54.77 TRINITY_DN67203_c4_g1_i1:54-926(+)
MSLETLQKEVKCMTDLYEKTVCPALRKKFTIEIEERQAEIEELAKLQDDADAMQAAVTQWAEQISEIENLQTECDCTAVGQLMAIRLRRLQAKHTLYKKEKARLVTASKPVPEDAKPVQKFAWDQSDKFVKIYISMDGLTPDSEIKTDFHPTYFNVVFFDVKETNYQFSRHDLCENINPATSDVLKKQGKCVIRLAKSTQKVEWTGIDDSEKKKKEQHRKLAASGASTQELLANMYNQADDKTREELSKAAFEGQKKQAKEREEKQKKQREAELAEQATKASGSGFSGCD